MKSKEIQLLKQDMNSMNHYIRRILDSTKLNQLDYNVCILILFLFKLHH